MNSPTHYLKRLSQISVSTLILVNTSALAQVTHYNIELTLVTVPNTATYSVGDQFFGNLVVDQSTLTNQGEEFLAIGAGLESIEFTFLDNFTYDESADLANDFPRALFSNGQLTGIDYLNNSGLRDADPNSFFSFLPDQSFQYSPEGVDEFDGAYSIFIPNQASVPEPSSSLLLVFSASFLLLNRKR